MAIKSITKLKKGLRTTLTNVPALIDTLEKGISEINEEISTGTEAKKAVDTFNTINGGLLSECKVKLTPVQSGSGDPSPTNVRPITGHTQVKVGDEGKNKLDISVTEIGTAWNGQPNTARARLIIPCKPSTYYTLSMNGTNNISNIYINDADIIPASGAGTEITSYPYTYYSRTTSKYIVIAFSKTDISQADVEALKFQLEEGQSATPYVPYNGYQVTVNLSETYYSGTLDVVSGVLTVDSDYIASYNGETLPSTWISDRDVYAVGNTPTIGAEVCYKLATPQTIQLTPQQVKALAGENHLSAPLGGQEIEEVEYKEIFTFADVEEAITTAIANVYPAAPSEDGNYVLTLVKDGTSITRSWVSTSINTNKKK